MEPPVYSPARKPARKRSSFATSWDTGSLDNGENTFSDRQSSPARAAASC